MQGDTIAATMEREFASCHGQRLFNQIWRKAQPPGCRQPTTSSRHQINCFCRRIGEAGFGKQGQRGVVNGMLSVRLHK